MKSKLIHENGTKTFAVVFDKGDEALEGLKSFALENSLSAAQITAVGAFSDAILGYFNYDKKDYERIEVDDQVEVLSFLGDVAVDEDKPSVHIHTVLGRSDGSTVGGHLLEGHVRPTLEVIIRETPASLQKTRDKETGLALISL